MIIDMHTHCFPDSLAERAVTKLSENSGLPVYTDGTAADTLKKLEENGVDYAVVLNIATKPGQDRKVNDFAIAANGGKLIHFGSVNPYSSMIEEEISRLKNAGIKGIKLHPEYQRFAADSEDAFEVYRAACDMDMIVAFHAGWDIAYPYGDNAHPSRLAKVIGQFPSMKIQLAHFGGMLRWDSVEEKIAGKDVYLDISMCGRIMDVEQAKRIIDKHGIDRIMFGTDCPWEEWKYMFEFVDKLNLSSSDYDKLMSGNAIKFLGLNI